MPCRQGWGMRSSPRRMPAVPCVIPATAGSWRPQRPSGGTYDSRRGAGARSHPQPHPRTHRPVALVAVPHPHGDRPWRGLDPHGLEITVASAVVDRLTEADTLNLSSTQAGLIATVYLIGEVVGALFFGRLSDKLGRKRLFVVTLAVYLIGSGLTAFTLGNSAFWIGFLYLTRFISGMGIGGEYAAINSAIDELIPARYRGRVDIAVNGTYWAGAILGTLGELVLLNALPHSIAWRIGFLIGPVLGLCIWNLRRHLPESPRWLIMHGREQ